MHPFVGRQKYQMYSVKAEPFHMHEVNFWGFVEKWKKSIIGAGREVVKSSFSVVGDEVVALVSEASSKWPST